MMNFIPAICCVALLGIASPTVAQTFTATHDELTAANYTAGQAISFGTDLRESTNVGGTYHVETIVRNAAGAKLASTYFYTQSIPASGKRYTYRYTVPASLPSGTYNYITSVWKTDWSRSYPVSQSPRTFTVGAASGSATHALSVVVASEGRVVSSPAGVDCVGDCSQKFPANAAVNLAATPRPGHVFSGWDGACAASQTPTCTVTLNEATTVKAVFSPLPVVLRRLAVDNVSIAGGTGHVTSAPSGIDCRAACETSFYEHAKVTLTAVPAAGSLFVKWVGAGCSGVSPTCVVGMAENRTATAYFVKQGSQQTLSINIDNPAGGSVTSAQASANCSAVVCKPSFTAGTALTLAARPKAGHYFAGWHGGRCAGTGETCNVKVNEYTDVFAQFLPVEGSMMPEVDTARIPPRAPGAAVEKVALTPQMPTSSDSGEFRATCSFSHMASVDPIAYPGRTAPHLHTFWGNTGVTANSSSASILSSGNSTCLGGTVNRSAYWVPTLIDTRTDTPIAPTEIITYYKSGPVMGRHIRPFPAGLRMIAGNMSQTNEIIQGFNITRYKCEGIAPGTSSPLSGQAIQNCPVGFFMTQEIFFPQCWDGKNLDVADHKSHMAYPIGGSCPASHPVPLPQITFNVRYAVQQANQPTHWRLSSDMYPTSRPGGYSSHGDWWNGWKQEVLEAWVKHCNNAEADCQAHLLGDGRALID